MPFPVQHLTVLQNWDCHGCGECCRDYIVTVTEEERRRIESQGWDKQPEFQGVELFKAKRGRKSTTSELNCRDDGSCVFLTDQGRCRIHELFGPEAKPLACRLFPFVFVPVGDRWRVGARFSCPSSAANRGRPLNQHGAELETFANQLAQATGFANRTADPTVPPPPMRRGQVFDWPDVLLFVKAILSILRCPEDRFERRLRKCLALDRLCRQANLAGYSGKRLQEFLSLVSSGIDIETPAEPAALGAPSWVGKVLFRQSLFLFARQDHGPKKGSALRSRLTVFKAAWRFATGRGDVPLVHAQIPHVTFDQVEATHRPYSLEMEQMLERYYSVKIESVQFCGPTNYYRPFWEGFEALALTFPIICWLARLFSDRPAEQAVQQAVSMVDSHFGYNPLLGGRRQRLANRLLWRTGELERLIAWYGR
jgi:lysine-N-methylase